MQGGSGRKDKKTPYFGSVRFYKNLILLTVVIMIAVPTVMCFRYKKQLKDTITELPKAPAEQEETVQEPETTAQQYSQNRVVIITDESGREITAVIPDEIPAEKLAYQEKYPDFYAPQEYSATVRKKAVAYLTFEDGPSITTDIILEELAKRNAKATFFVTGASGTENAARIRKIVEQGHTIAMHSYSNSYDSIYTSVDAFLDDMYQIFSYIKELTGVTPTHFRMPGGTINKYNVGLYQEITSEMLRRGFIPCDWDVSGEDEDGSKESESIVVSVCSGLADTTRPVIALHDGSVNETTGAAIGTIIDKLEAQGYKCEAMDATTMPVVFSYYN